MKKDIQNNISGKIWIFVLMGVIMICLSCLIYFYSPLQMIISKLLTLESGSVMFKLWSSPPYDITMKLYIFNVTNPEEFLRGEEKLNVTEVGPYCYREVLTNMNTSFNEEEGTLMYSPNREYIVDLECSVTDPAKTMLLIPNIPLLGIQSYLSDSFLTSLGFSTLSATLGAKPFLNVTVHEYLWGYEDKLVTVANQFLPNWIDFGKFGIIERLLSRDNTNIVTLALKPEKIKSRYSHLLNEDMLSKPYHINKWNGLEGLPEWGFDPSDEAVKTTKRCQLVEGDFDGTIYPSPMNKSSSIVMFRKAFCRPIYLEFTGETTTDQGFRSYDFKMPKNMFASPEENPINECYCDKGKCPEKGLQSIGVCYYDIPIVLSQPHFLNSPPDIVNSVNGLSPDEGMHNSIAKLQPDIGIPLDGSALRIQVNLGVGETRYNTKTKPFNGLTVPMLWINVACDELPSIVDFLVRLAIDVAPIAQKVLMYLLGILGLALISGAALLTLVFTKTVVPRSMSIVSDYSPVPLITIPAQYFKEREMKLYK